MQARTWKDEDLSHAHFADAELVECHFERCRFGGTDLSETVTHRCVFTECEFPGARMNASRHEGSAFLNCSFRLANLFNASFLHCKMTGSSMEEATFAGVTILRGDWSFVNLRHHSLRRSDLRHVNFADANLYACQLEGADLRHADLTRAILTAAHLRGADLRGATVDGVDLTSVDLHGVRMDIAQAVLLARGYGAIVD